MRLILGSRNRVTFFNSTRSRVESRIEARKYGVPRNYITRPITNRDESKVLAATRLHCATPNTTSGNTKEIKTESIFFVLSELFVIAVSCIPLDSVTVSVEPRYDRAESTVNNSYFFVRAVYFCVCGFNAIYERDIASLSNFELELDACTVFVFASTKRVSTSPGIPTLKRN